MSRPTRQAKKPSSEAVRVARISAGATLGAAIIAGAFLLVSQRASPPQQPPSSQTSTGTSQAVDLTEIEASLTSKDQSSRLDGLTRLTQSRDELQPAQRQAAVNLLTRYIRRRAFEVTGQSAPKYAEELDPKLAMRSAPDDLKTAFSVVQDIRALGGAKVGLSGLPLVRVDLTGINFSGIDLRKSDLVGSRLDTANFEGADLTGASLRHSFSWQANFRKAVLHDVNLTAAGLSETNLVGTKLTTANLSGADLTGADASGADFTDANLIGTNLSLRSYQGAVFGSRMVCSAGTKWPQGFPVPKCATKW